MGRARRDGLLGLWCKRTLAEQACQGKRDQESKTSNGQRKYASGLPVYEKQCEN